MPLHQIIDDIHILQSQGLLSGPTDIDMTSACTFNERVSFVAIRLRYSMGCEDEQERGKLELSATHRYLSPAIGHDS